MNRLRGVAGLMEQGEAVYLPVFPNSARLVVWAGPPDPGRILHTAQVVLCCDELTISGKPVVKDGKRVLDRPKPMGLAGDQGHEIGEAPASFRKLTNGNTVQLRMNRPGVQRRSYDACIPRGAGYVATGKTFAFDYDGKTRLPAIAVSETTYVLLVRDPNSRRTCLVMVPRGETIAPTAK
jgi:hypothetical protein